MEPTTQFSIADARPDNWVERIAPEPWRPYLRVARLDRPIGIWLLLWPCWWSTALAARAADAPYPNPWLLILFAIGATAMRSAGCAYNDFVDRDVDAKVARTRMRPIASGKINTVQAVTFTVALCLVGLLVLVQLNRFAILTGLASMSIVGLYPFAKRVTNWPQAVLGLAFSWGALMGWAAVFGRLDPAPLTLYAGAIAWTIGYDTIYAHQDKEDDALLGLKSTALHFGAATRGWLVLFFTLAWLGIVLAGALAGAGGLFCLLMLPAAAHLVWQVATLDIDDGDNCLIRFRANRDFGALVFAALVLDTAVANLT